jgi:hypothetical protein
MRISNDEVLSTNTASRSRGAICPRFAIKFRCPPIRGRRECRAPDAPDSRVCRGSGSRHTRCQVTPESPGIPRAMVLTVSFALSPVTGLSCHRRPRKLLSANLTPASGRQDHTTSPSASRIARQARSLRPPHPAPRFVTLRNAPLWDGTARVIKVIWVFGKSEYFCKEGWTEGLINCPGDLPVGSDQSEPTLVMAGLDPANHVSLTAGEGRRGCPAIADKVYAVRGTQAAMAGHDGFSRTTWSATPPSAST